jgi:predicted O-methyltransferase YrrM
VAPIDGTGSGARRDAECGSGLSTILLGLIAANTGARIFSLEHDREWLAFLQTRLRPLGLKQATLRHAPLADYGAFDWYTDDQINLRERIYNLVLCDGPPNSTRGGRYGLLSRLINCLAPGAPIIVDDSQRTDEAQMIGRWISEHEGRLTVEETYPTFAVLRLVHSGSLEPGPS